MQAHTSTTQTMITLTKKTGVLLHGAAGRAFVRTRSGVGKFLHLTSMIDHQLNACLDAPQPPQQPVLQLALQPPPQQAPQQAPQQTQVVYVREASTFRSMGFKIWWPSSMGNVTTYIAYTPPTKLEDPDKSVLTGAEVVMSPVIINHSQQPWRNPVPALMFEWPIAMQHPRKTSPSSGHCLGSVAVQRGV